MVQFFDEWRASRKSVPFMRRWIFAIGLGLVLGVLSLISRGTLVADAGLTSPCQVTVVNADTLPVRAQPDASIQQKPLYDLKRGQQRGATTTVQNGYRKLSDGNWALDLYLQPLPPPLNKCGPD
jgi:hypothetical protein